MSDWRRQAREIMDIQDLAYSGPIGDWRERWIPGYCKHEAIRCIHGDEIIHRNFRRRLCMVCWRALPGDLPADCFFGGTHT